MFVIVTYDVSAKRVAKVMKICRKYLNQVQKSVFEGMISDAGLSGLKREITNKIDPAEDQICIYEFSSLKFTQKEMIGVEREQGNII